MLEEAEGLKRYGVKVNCLYKKEMEKLGMNAILGIGRGSEYPTYLITMEYGNFKNKQPIALVGKGLTFDSGGLCLKPSHKMGEMKGDMTGAALVIGSLMSLAMRKVQSNIVGVIGVTENMISGNAQRPGDVIVSMSGKTIEIDNTDAEGRLLLADALWYTQEKFSPGTIIDFATLTGAIQVTFGSEFAGLFSNNDALANTLIVSGRTVGEKLWRLPLHDSYSEYIKSDIADIINTNSVKGAGSITAAMFLQSFIKNGVKWAHIDIASTEWDSRSRALSIKGATGFGVSLINDFIDKYCSGDCV
jgi:leucyl aminopeptidase